jgi:hypothetical protein
MLRFAYMIEEVPMPDVQADLIRRFVNQHPDRVKALTIETKEYGAKKLLVISEAHESVPIELMQAILLYQQSHVLNANRGRMESDDCSKVALEFVKVFKPGGTIARQLSVPEFGSLKIDAEAIQAGVQGGPVMPFYAKDKYDWHMINLVSIFDEKSGTRHAAVDLTAAYTMPGAKIDIFVVVERSAEAVQKTLKELTVEEWSLPDDE